MNKSLKFLGLGAVGLTTAALCGVPYYSSTALSDKLNHLSSQGQAQDGFLVRNLQHQAGFLGSKGSAEILITDRCHTGDGASSNAWRIEYDASHIPTPTAANRFSWRLIPLGDNAKLFRQIFGADAPLRGEGQVSWAGLVKSNIALPAMSYANAKETFEATPSQGTVAFNDKAFQLDWKLDRLLLRGQDNAIEVKQVGVLIDLSNHRRGIGEMALRVAEFSSKEASGKGLLVQSVTTEHQDRIDSTLTETLQHIQWDQQELKQLALEASVKGLHGPSVETLTAMLSSSCGVQALTRDESSKVRQAVQTLLASGFSAGITKLSGQTKDGGVDGAFNIQLAAAGPGQALSFAKLLSSDGKLSIKGHLMTPEQMQMLAQSGFLKETPDGWSSAFRFDKGELSINGQPMNSRPIQAILAMADTMVVAYLDGKKAFPSLASHDADEVPSEEPVEEVLADAPADPTMEDARAAPAALAEPAQTH